MKEFHYVIARKWSNGQLSTYAYGKEVFHGSIEDARAMRKFISDREKEEYQIYKIDETEIK